MDSNRSVRISAALVLGFLTFAIFGQLRAEHEADHRYNIRGYLLDASDRGIADQKVLVFDRGKLLASAETDQSGYYSMHLHLHDEDLGRKLTLQAGSSKAQLRVKFDPGDKTTVRRHDANFVAGEFYEGELGRFRVPPWTYAVAGLALFALTLVMLEKRRRAKLRNEAKAIHATGGKAKGKKRRKKR